MKKNQNLNHPMNQTKLSKSQALPAWGKALISLLEDNL